MLFESTSLGVLGAVPVSPHRPYYIAIAIAAAALCSRHNGQRRTHKNRIRSSCIPPQEMEELRQKHTRCENPLQLKSRNVGVSVREKEGVGTTTEKKKEQGLPPSPRGLLAAVTLWRLFIGQPVICSVVDGNKKITHTLASVHWSIG